MRIRTRFIALVSVTWVLALLAPRASAGELSPAITEGLATSKYVYISSMRKDGSFGKAAEIWFFYHQGAVYVGTPPSTWRVRRIKAGRPQANIAVGKPDGSSFLATGAIVNDPEVQAGMMETYAKKYPDRWQRYEENFRTGFQNGSRVLVKYTPKED